jgi:hypothetical protein
LQTFTNELGLIPPSRARINLPKENVEDDPVEAFLKENDNEFY